MSAYTAERFAAESSRLWLRVARLIAKSAAADAGKGYAKIATEKARLSDYCLWQATGEGDCASWREITGADQ